MGKYTTCENCGKEFDTIKECKQHECDNSEAGPIPDYKDPFSPSRDGEKEMACLHCGSTFSESEIVYEKRFGRELWWCPIEGCDGAGVGIDIQEADSMPESHY